MICACKRPLLCISSSALSVGLGGPRPGSGPNSRNPKGPVGVQDTDFFKSCPLQNGKGNPTECPAERIAGESLQLGSGKRMLLPNAAATSLITLVRLRSRKQRKGCLTSEASLSVRWTTQHYKSPSDEYTSKQPAAGER